MLAISCNANAITVALSPAAMVNAGRQVAVRVHFPPVEPYGLTGSNQKLLQNWLTKGKQRTILLDHSTNFVALAYETPNFRLKFREKTGFMERLRYGWPQ